MKKVLGMGNALVDILISLKDDEKLARLETPKCSMTLVNKQKVNTILSNTPEKEIIRRSAGGSAANTINGLAVLGLETGFIGKIGDDDFGRFFEDEMKNRRVKTVMLTGREQTGKCVVMVSQDSERTFATYLGAAVEMTPHEILPAFFENYDLFHVEGYLVQDHALLERSLKLAHAAGSKISLDLASFNIVDENLDFLRRMIRDYVDIVFANEDEARVFSGLDDPEQALGVISSYCELAVVKIGAGGSLIRKGEDTVRVDAVSARVMDTTGAGDLYAAGFLYGMSRGNSLDTCGRIGSLLGANVVEVIGAKMDDSRWQKIFSGIKEIEG